MHLGKSFDPRRYDHAASLPDGELTLRITIRNLTSQRLDTRLHCLAFYKHAKWPRENITCDQPSATLLTVEPFSTGAADITSCGLGKDEHKANGTTGLLVELNDAETRTTSTLYFAGDKSPDHLTSFFDSNTQVLTVLEAPDLSCWMKDFRDDTSIAALSIPGTHNSPTCHWALPSVRCQAVSPLEQLKNGVRFFDVRVQPASANDPSNETLYLVHGAFPTTLIGYRTFRELVDTIETFLQAHTSETLIMSVKREGIGKANDEQLADVLATHYAQNWYTEPSIPTLGQARGRIVLMRRFRISESVRKQHDGHDWALDAESWEDNTASCVHGQVCVQDYYDVRDTTLIPKKLEVSCAQFERAATAICPIAQSSDTQPPQILYLNFLTASNFFNFKCWPENIAKRLNPGILRFLCQKHDCGTTGTDDKPSSGGDGGLGIVVCDWVGKGGNWDLVKCIVGMNSRRLYKERGHGWAGNCITSEVTAGPDLIEAKHT